jgi:hypothetical protein
MFTASATMYSFSLDREIRSFSIVLSNSGLSRGVGRSSSFPTCEPLIFVEIAYRIEQKCQTGLQYNNSYSQPHQPGDNLFTQKLLLEHNAVSVCDPGQVENYVRRKYRTVPY